MKSILVVDDDADVREIVAFKLGRLGYEVITASDGATGLEAVAQLRPDLVLLDWAMPELSGIEVCRLLRGRAEAPAPRSIPTRSAPRSSGAPAGASPATRRVRSGPPRPDGRAR